MRKRTWWGGLTDAAEAGASRICLARGDWKREGGRRASGRETSSDDAEDDEDDWDDGEDELGRRCTCSILSFLSSECESTCAR